MKDMPRFRAAHAGSGSDVLERLVHLARVGAQLLQHRLLLNYDGQAENLDLGGLVIELVNHVPEEA